MKNNVLRTSFRSEIHATDSTCSGWITKSAATTALRYTALVIVHSTTNNRTVLAM